MRIAPDADRDEPRQDAVREPRSRHGRAVPAHAVDGRLDARGRPPTASGPSTMSATARPDERRARRRCSSAAAAPAPRGRSAPAGRRRSRGSDARRRGQPEHPARQVAQEVGVDHAVHPDPVVGARVVAHRDVAVPGERRVVDDLLGALDRRHRDVAGAVDDEDRLVHPALVRRDVEVGVLEPAAGDRHPDGARDRPEHAVRHARVAQVGVDGERGLLRGAAPPATRRARRTRGRGPARRCTGAIQPPSLSAYTPTRSGSTPA